MLKIVQVTTGDNYFLNCTFNNGIHKELPVLPLLENHKHLKGIEKLRDKQVFNKAGIGIFGEIFWENIIETKASGETQYWNYDISPEYVFYNGK